MKAFRILLITALVALLALPASAAVTTVLSAVTATGASSAVDTGNAEYVRVQVFSAAGSTATVTIEQSTNGTVWYTVATITDPSATGELWSVASVAYTRVNVTARSAGTITATVEVQR
jgi:streptogramin lyase